MMDKSKKVKEKNRLRKWKRKNHEEVKIIIAQAEKSSKWKGLRTIFSFSSYQILDPVEEKI
jgi:hypothetical protein